MQFASKKVEGRVALFACQIVAGMVFTLIAYITGWLQYAAVSGLDLQAAFAVSVAPFIVPDIREVVGAVGGGQPVGAMAR